MRVWGLCTAHIEAGSMTFHHLKSTEIILIRYWRQYLQMWVNDKSYIRSLIESMFLFKLSPCVLSLYNLN